MLLYQQVPQLEESIWIRRFNRVAGVCGEVTGIFFCSPFSPHFQPVPCCYVLLPTSGMEDTVQDDFGGAGTTSLHQPLPKGCRTMTAAYLICCPCQDLQTYWSFLPRSSALPQCTAGEGMACCYRARRAGGERSWGKKGSKNSSSTVEVMACVCCCKLHWY